MSNYNSVVETAVPSTVSSGVNYNLATFPDTNPDPVTEIVSSVTVKASAYSSREGVAAEA